LIVNKAIAVGSATVGTDIAGNEWFQESDRARTLRAWGMWSGTTTASGIVEIFFGSRKVGEVKGQAAPAGAGADVSCPAGADLVYLSGNEVCPPGTPIHLIIKVAPGTNGVALTMELAEI